MTPASSLADAKPRVRHTGATQNAARSYLVSSAEAFTIHECAKSWHLLMQPCYMRYGGCSLGFGSLMLRVNFRPVTGAPDKVAVHGPIVEFTSDDSEESSRQCLPCVRIWIGQAFWLWFEQAEVWLRPSANRLPALPDETEKVRFKTYRNQLYSRKEVIAKCSIHV